MSVARRSRAPPRRGGSGQGSERLLEELDPHLTEQRDLEAGDPGARTRRGVGQLLGVTPAASRCGRGQEGLPRLLETAGV